MKNIELSDSETDEIGGSKSASSTSRPSSKVANKDSSQSQRSLTKTLSKPSDHARGSRTKTDITPDRFDRVRSKPSMLFIEGRPKKSSAVVHKQITDKHGTLQSKENVDPSEPMDESNTESS